MRTIRGGVFGLIVWLLMGSTLQPAWGSIKKILLIPTELDHPWATHMYSQGCRILAECLNRNANIEAIVCPDFDWPSDPEIFRGVDAIVYYSRPAGDIILKPERKQILDGLFEKKVGFVALHWSTATADPDLGPAYLEILGGWFHFDHSGLKVDQRPLIQVEPDHPICRGWKTFELLDEYYLNLKFHEKARPIIQVNVEGANQTVAWVMEHEGGRRSFGATLGHFHSNFGIPEFRRAICNGILWAAHAEIPEDGSTVEVPQEQLVLPENPPN